MFADFLNDINFSSQQPELSFSQEESGPSGQTTAAETRAGILPLTVALCRNLSANQRAFEHGSVDAYGQEFPFAEFVGFILDLQATDETWSFDFTDATGRIEAVYQVNLDLDTNYAEDLKKIKPIDVENGHPIQFPVRLIAIPQVLQNNLALQVVFMRPTTFTDAYAQHPMAVCNQFLHNTSKADETTATEIPGGFTHTAVKKSAELAVAEDPFGNEEITIANADIADLVGADRLHRVVWKLMDTNCVRLVDNGCVYREWVVTKCRLWPPAEVEKVINDLEDAGVLVFANADGSKLMLVRD